MVLRRDVGGVVEVVDAEGLFHIEHALVGEGGGLALLVDGVVLFLFEPADDLVDLLIEIGGLVGRAGDDERGTGFVDEDGVHFVDDGVMVTALHKLLGVKFHVVAQVVEAELVVRAVGDVRGVGFLALFVAQARDDDADAEAEEGIEPAHPFGVTLGEVVVDGHDMHALAFKRVEDDGQRGDEGFAFAGLHFGDLALVERHRAEKLHIVMAHAEHADAGFADQREHFRQHGVDVLFAALHLIPINRQTLRQLLVRKSLHFGLKRIDFCHQRPELFQKTIVFTTENLAYEETYHENSRKRGYTASTASLPNKTCFPDWQMTTRDFSLSWTRHDKRMPRRGSRMNNDGTETAARPRTPFLPSSIHLSASSPHSPTLVCPNPHPAPPAVRRRA